MKLEQYLGKGFWPVWLFFPYLFEIEAYLHVSKDRKLQP